MSRPTINACIHLLNDTTIEAYYSTFDGTPVVKLGEANDDVTIFLPNAETARRLAEVILKMLDVRPVARKGGDK